MVENFGKNVPIQPCSLTPPQRAPSRTSQPVSLNCSRRRDSGELRGARPDLDPAEMERPGQPAELPTAHMLADPLSSYVSGATIAVTGGKKDDGPLPSTAVTYCP